MSEAENHETEAHEPVPEQYSELEDIYASKDLDGRAEMFLRATSETQAKAMLLVELAERGYGLEDSVEQSPMPTDFSEAQQTLRKQYGSKDYEGRIKMLQNAADKEEVKAMLSVERPELAGDPEEGRQGEERASRGTPEQMQRQAMMERLRESNPDQWKQIVEADTEDAWEIYQRAEEQTRQEAMERARDTIHQAETMGAEFDNAARRKLIDHELANVEKPTAEHLDRQPVKRSRRRPTLAARMLRSIGRLKSAAMPYVRKFWKGFENRVLQPAQAFGKKARHRIERWSDGAARQTRKLRKAFENKVLRRP